jgi:hypothetical protein
LRFLLVLVGFAEGKPSDKKRLLIIGFLVAVVIRIRNYGKEQSR